MTTATIHLPEDLMEKAERSAEVRGLSLNDFVRETLEARLLYPVDTRPGPEDRWRPADMDYQNDPLFNFTVYEGPAPADGSARHDDYLYGDES